jgi:hypothetical protein
MRLIQRLSAWTGWALLFTVGVLLILEGASVIGAAWREWIGDAAVWMTQPPFAAWLAALLGVLLGLVALVILFAQFVPIRLTRATTIVERSAAGSTVVAPIVIRKAAVARLKKIDGVVDAVTFSHDKRCLSLRARLERNADASRIEHEARAALGEGFWSMLGLPPERIDLTLTYSTVLMPSSPPE